MDSQWLYIKEQSGENKYLSVFTSTIEMILTSDKNGLTKVALLLYFAKKQILKMWN